MGAYWIIGLFVLFAFLKGFNAWINKIIKY